MVVKLVDEEGGVQCKAKEALWCWRRGAAGSEWTKHELVTQGNDHVITSWARATAGWGARDAARCGEEGEAPRSVSTLT